MALKLLTEDLVHIGPAVSVAAVVLVLLVGTAASLAAGRRPLGPRVRAFVDDLGERRERHRQPGRVRVRGRDDAAVAGAAVVAAAGVP